MRPKRVRVRPKRVLYGKLRPVLFDPKRWGTKGGDPVVPMVLEGLARRHPDVEFWVVGRANGTPDNWMPDNVHLAPQPRLEPGRLYEPTAREQRWLWDGEDTRALIWLGQHSSCNIPMPKVGDRTQLTKPFGEFERYAGCITANVRDSIIEPTWLLADPRNGLKAREVPPPAWSVLSPYTFEETRTFDYGDCTEKATVAYEAAGVEFLGVPQNWVPTREWAERSTLRVLTHPTPEKEKLFAEWLPPDVDLAGNWPDRAKGILWTEIPEYLGGAKATVFTPTHLGAGWPAEKAWMAYALGTVCFFLPGADDRGQILPLEGDFANWLRPETPADLAVRLNAIEKSQETYEMFRDVQLDLLAHARTRDLGYAALEQRLELVE